MQIFLPSPSCLQTARQLDQRRLNKQIIEAAQILRAIDGEGKGWRNHPATRMYRPHKNWLQLYRSCLMAYQQGDMEAASAISHQADAVRPPFVTDDFCRQHARRLYTKAPELYPQFSSLGTSIENWYVVDGNLLRYVNGKRI
jgi:hypothetical protein